jgi:hypothetical protein
VLITEEADDKRNSAAKENTQVTPIPRRQMGTRGALNSQRRGNWTDKEQGCDMKMTRVEPTGQTAEGQVRHKAGVTLKTSEEAARSETRISKVSLGRRAE